MNRVQFSKYFYGSISLISLFKMAAMTSCSYSAFFIFRYGIGMIYYKQEKFNLAEILFRKALSINPSSSVLFCHVGVVSSLSVVYLAGAASNQ